MDLLEMINNGAEALHRGSVDREDMESVSQDVRKQDSAAKQPPPIWARVYRGSRNRVRDERRMALAETRPELAAMFSSGHEADDADYAVSVEDPDSAVSTAVSDGQQDRETKDPVNALIGIGPGGNASLTGLAPSIASIIPNDDQTKVLAGWIFEQTQKITDDSLLDNIEVEFKIGLITDEHSRLRHRFSSISECVLDPNYFVQNRLRFKSNVDPKQFRSLESLLDDVMSNNAASANNQLTRDNILARDAAYQVPYEPLGPGRHRVRVTSDERGRVLECMSKERIGDFHIALPNCPCDLKMSLSIEHPVDTENFMPIIKGMQPNFERNKNRLKWTAPGCEIDLTSVHGQGGNGTPQITKEAEIETNTKMLATVLREYRTQVNPSQSLDKFLEVIRYTMDTARYLTRNL